MPSGSQVCGWPSGPSTSWLFMSRSPGPIVISVTGATFAGSGSTVHVYLLVGATGIDANSCLSIARISNVCRPGWRFAYSCGNSQSSHRRSASVGSDGASKRHSKTMSMIVSTLSFAL